jgi:hypothetical protein
MADDADDIGRGGGGSRNVNKAITGGVIPNGQFDPVQEVGSSVDRLRR